MHAQPQQRPQRPACMNTRILTTDDAHRIFHATGVMRPSLLGPMINRRLDAEERRFVQPGAVFVWEERNGSETTGLGIERWTDGLRWGPSRVRDFLYYREKFTRYDGEDVLIKQTYSAWVTLPNNSRRKWHLTAYFTEATVDKMKTVDEIPCMREVMAPPGMYKRARSEKRRKGIRHLPVNDHPSPHSDSHSQPEDSPTLMPFDPRLNTPPPVKRFCVSESEDIDNDSPTLQVQVTYPRKNRLAPLSYLQSLNHMRRHPADEHILRAFPSIN